MKQEHPFFTLIVSISKLLKKIINGKLLYHTKLLGTELLKINNSEDFLLSKFLKAKQFSGSIIYFDNLHIIAPRKREVYLIYRSLKLALFEK